MSPADGHQPGASKAVSHGAPPLTEESRLLLAAMLREDMRMAVSEGIQEVLTNEHFWAKVFEVLQKQATERTGRFVLGGITHVLKKVAWAAVFALVVYSIGGWVLVKTIWAAMSKG